MLSSLGEFSILNDEFYIKTDELFLENDEFVKSSADGSHLNQIRFVLKFVLKMFDCFSGSERISNELVTPQWCCWVRFRIQNDGFIYFTKTDDFMLTQ